MDEEFAELIYACVTRDEALSVLLHRLAASFDCQSAVLFYQDRARPSAAFLEACGPFSDAEVQRRYNSDFAALDPAPAALARLPVGNVASTDVLFAGSMERYRPFLDGFFHPIGLHGALGGPLALSDDRLGMVAVHRGPQRAAFDAEDAYLLAAQMPHLMRMLELRQVFFQLSRTAASLTNAIDSSPMAILITETGSGLLTQANTVARDLIARADGLRISRAGQVESLDRAADRKLKAAMAPSAPRNRVKLVRVPRVGAQSSYVLSISGGAAEAQQATTIYISDPDRRSGDAPADLAEALGLTLSGALLVTALLRGETLDEYAARAAISRSTAKYHLREAFAVTGTRRQSDLLMHAMAVARDLAL